MTRIIDTTSKRRRSARLAAGIAISAILAVGTFAGTASARDRDDGGRRGWGGGWSGGYYAAPPVVYGSTYGYGYYGSPYYAPPVVYGPAVGISLPGINVGIR
ncbi:MAG TPA: hypothetical protein VGS13_01245 [Stellaceae bacterium]|nr:hypothetical protein [Stellaceae bacterium]